MMTATLASLKDVGGIVGSFVVDDAGALLGRDLPGIFGDSVLTEAGERIGRLLSAVDAADWTLLRFSEHRLFVKRLDGGCLCVLAGLEANLPALRMAAALVGKRIAPTMRTQMPLTSEPPRASSPAEARRSIPPPLPPRVNVIDVELVEPDRASEPPDTARSAAMASVARVAPEARGAAPAGPRARMFRGKRYDT
jgi:predicted regulator of Ras-like GTPase activity (Roadblock/LC7/MglB family)